MKTKTRLLLSLGALTFLVFVLAGVGIASINQLRGEGGQVLRANYMSLAYMEDMLAALEEAPETGIPRAKEQLTLQQANITEIGEQEATAALAAAFAAWETSGQDSLLTRTLTARIRSILELNRDAIVRKAAQTGERGDKAVVWITLSGTLCALIALSMLFGMAEFLSAPIRALTAGIDRVAQGNYRERIFLDRKDEFGHMAERFNAMASELEKWESSNLSRIMEEKTRAEAVIQSLQDASIGLDDHERILFINQEALDLLGLHEINTTGKPATEVAKGNDFLRHVLNDKSSAPFKAVVNGKENYFVSGSTPIQGPNGVIGTLFTIRDITPFKERDLAKTNFLATISHELKTPLASTDIGLTLLERQSATTLTADQGAIVSDLRKDHQRLVRIVSELLDLAQAESGNIRVQLTELSLDRVVQEALAAVKVSARQKNILFAVNANDTLVRADADKAVWVLVNLLSNAVRHSPQGGKVTIGTSTAHGQMVLSIIDQGPGIPPAEQEHLFERFARGTSTHNSTGLGLSIAKEFMVAMGGDIRFDGTATGGTSFILTFAAAR
ncbi:MAG: ATP-binding protein [Flavobacteriales bacterium]